MFIFYHSDIFLFSERNNEKYEKYTQFQTMQGELFTKIVINHAFLLQFRCLLLVVLVVGSRGQG